jgi:signal transduction histidine kinase
MSFTHSLLGFARKQRGGTQQVDLVGLLDESIELLAPEIKQRAVEIRRNYDGTLPGPFTDPTLLQQVLVNLLTNAVDAVNEKQGEPGWIEVETRRASDGRVAISVHDNGIGIDPKERAEIFELFHTSKPPGKGTGIGLAIVLDIVRRLGAEIDVESEPGVGSRFTVTLPREGQSRSSVERGLT